LAKLDDTLVIIPTLNEEEGVELVIKELVEAGVDKKNILVVDGGSTDKTVEKAEGMGVKVIMQRGRGKANAVLEGLEEAYRRGYKYACVIDADYTYPAKAIPFMKEKMEREKLDEVIGARARGRENIPLMNRLGNRLLTWLFNTLFGTRLTDLCSGLYMVRLDALFRENPKPIETSGFSVEADIAAKIASATGRVGEVPIEYRRRMGRAKLRVLDGLRIAVSIIKLAWRYNPVFLLFTIASLLLIPGIVLGGYVAVKYFAFGVKHYVKAIIAVMLFTTGIIALMFSLQSLYMKRLEYRVMHRLRLIEEEVRRKEVEE